MQLKEKERKKVFEASFFSVFTHPYSNELSAHTCVTADTLGSPLPTSLIFFPVVSFVGKTDFSTHCLQRN